MRSRSLAFSDLIVLMAVLCALFLSGAALNNLGLNYSTDTSSGGLKLHPYTLLTALAAVLVVCSRIASRGSLNNRQFVSAVVGASLTFGILVIKSIVGDSRSLGFVVDTIIAAFLLAAALSLTSSGIGTYLSRILTLFLIIECVLAIGEVIARANLIPIDTWYGEYFRATALQGHPLNNALVVVTVATSLQAYAGRRRSTFIFLLAAGALVAFGARGALSVYLVLNVFRFVRFGLKSRQRRLVLIAGGVPLAIGLSWIVVSGVIGERIAQVGASDDSSRVRLQSLQLVQRLNWSQLIFGSSTNGIDHLLSSANISVVENFLVGYLLSFGALLTAIIFWCVYHTCHAVMGGLPHGGRKRLRTIILVFVCTALTNNSLATKTPALYLLVAGLWCARCHLSGSRSPQKAAARRAIPIAPTSVSREPVHG